MQGTCFKTSFTTEHIACVMEEVTDNEAKSHPIAY